jgi:hypothetical protein
MANAIVQKFITDLTKSRRIYTKSDSQITCEGVVLTVDPNIESENPLAYRMEVPLDGAVLDPNLMLFLEVLFGRASAFQLRIHVEKLLLDHHPFRVSTDHLQFRAEMRGQAIVLLATPVARRHPP